MEPEEPESVVFSEPSIDPVAMADIKRRVEATNAEARAATEAREFAEAEAAAAKAASIEQAAAEQEAPATEPAEEAPATEPAEEAPMEPLARSSPGSPSVAQMPELDEERVSSLHKQLRRFHSAASLAASTSPVSMRNLADTNLPPRSPPSAGSSDGGGAVIDFGSPLDNFRCPAPLSFADACIDEESEEEVDSPTPLPPPAPDFQRASQRGGGAWAAARGRMVCAALLVTGGLVAEFAYMQTPLIRKAFIVTVRPALLSLTAKLRLRLHGP